MAIVQLIFAAAAKQSSKILNTAFGWATVMLFGKVAADRQIYLSLISLGSVLWLIVVLGVVFPSAGTFLLSFVALPDWVEPAWVRLAMLGSALVIPLLVGLLATRLRRADAQSPAEGFGKTILGGYPATLGLAVTLIMLTVLAPIMQLRLFAKRWTSAHVPMIVEPQVYLAVVQEIQDALKEAGIATHRTRASWMIRVPTKVLTSLAGGAVQNLVANELTVLVSSKLEVLLHPADLVLSGGQREVDSARALVAERLMFSSANLTWTQEANDLENQLREVWRKLATASDQDLRNRGPDLLADAAQRVQAAPLSFDEWQILNRIVLAIDRAILAVAAEAVEQPRELVGGRERLASPRLKTRSESDERFLVRALSFLGWAGMAIVSRRTATGKKMLGNGVLLNVARLGWRASTKPF